MLNFAAFITKLAAAQAFPSTLDSTGQKAMFNEALEELVTDVRFNGAQRVLQITVNSSGILTLPRAWQTIQGVQVNGFVRDLASIWYNFFPGTSASCQWSTNVVDRGDGWATFGQPRFMDDNVTPEPAQLRVTSVGGTGSFEVHGTDADGQEIFDGAQHGVALTFNAAKTGPYFSNIREVIKPVTSQIANLYACYDDGTEEIIGIYEPGETVPSYRQYLVPEANEVLSDDLTSTPVLALSLRRHIDMVADNDIVPVQHFGAMKNAIAAIHWRNEADEARSDKHLSFAIESLNKELKRLHPPSEVGAMRVNAKLCAGHNLWMIR